MIYNLILGPVQSGTSGQNGAVNSKHVFTLPVALWLTLLLAYFPAAQKNRIPAMPIGLAFRIVDTGRRPSDYTLVRSTGDDLPT